MISIKSIKKFYFDVLKSNGAYIIRVLNQKLYFCKFDIFLKHIQIIYLFYLKHISKFGAIQQLSTGKKYLPEVFEYLICFGIFTATDCAIILFPMKGHLSCNLSNLVSDVVYEIPMLELVT